VVALSTTSTSGAVGELAYEIRKKSEGIYAVINVTAEPNDIKELDRQFTINEAIMRTKVIRPDLH
jgi:small subunit ribosomal protein S6